MPIYDDKLESPLPTVVLGEDKTLDVKLKNKITRDPIDLTAATEIVAILPNADSTTFLEKKLSTAGVVLINGPTGHFQIIISASESSLLSIGSSVYIDIRFTIGGKLTKVVIKDAITIISPAYPTAP